MHDTNRSELEHEFEFHEDLQPALTLTRDAWAGHQETYQREYVDSWVCQYLLMRVVCDYLYYFWLSAP